MNRRNFLLQSGLLAGMGLPFGAKSHTLSENHQPADIKPFLLEPKTPLEHNGGLNIRTWVRNEMTNGLYSSVETAVAPKTMGPPPHYHKELDELMYVLEGTASVWVEGEIVEVKAGGWHMRPRLIEHTFWNNHEKPLRFIDMYFNQAFEQYLESIFFELTEKNGYPEGSEKKMKALAALNEKFGLVFKENAFSVFDELKKKYSLK